jgi:P27 family predicted phage terminase small subunit
MRGRKPKPTALHRANGNPSKLNLAKIEATEPKPDPTMPECPPHLNKGARAEWNRVCPELHRLGLLTSVDMAALAAYCANYERWQAAESILKDKGLVTVSGNGSEVKRPEVSIANDAMKLVLKFASEFGLTPSSRARVKVEPKQQADPFAAFIGDAPAMKISG